MTGTPQVGPSAGDGQSVVTVGQFFSTLRRKLLVVLTMVLLGILAAGALLLNTAKTYEATAVVDISPTSGAAASTVSTITESRIVTSTSVAMAAQQTLAYTGTPTELAEQVTVTSPLASQVLYITFAAETAQGAADGANAFANAYLDYRTEIAQKDLTLRIGRIQSQVADLQRALGAGQTDATQRASLQNQIQQLQNQLNTLQTSVISPGQVAGAAAVPPSPSSPRPLLYLAGGLLIGLLLGIILAVVRDRRDDRVRASTDLEQSLGAPVIAEFVADEGGSRPESLAATAADRSTEADAYRTVTTAVTSHSAGSRVVLLCGTGQEGLSLAPMNLAATFATQGLRTVIAGPERAVAPAIELLGVQGVTSLRGARLADQLVPSTQLPGLLVLSLGDEVGLGATLRANGDNLSEILAKVDIIVLDGVNIELPSTSLRLGQIADEAVVVAYKGYSTHAEIERLARQLAQVSVTVLGCILLSRRSRLRGKLGQRPPRGGDHAAAGPGHHEAVHAQPSRVEPQPGQAHELADAPTAVTAVGPRRGGSGSETTRPGFPPASARRN